MWEALRRAGKTIKDMVTPTVPQATTDLSRGADHTSDMLREIVARMERNA